jgi:pilus assembly protein Flp/PilA
LISLSARSTGGFDNHFVKDSLMLNYVRTAMALKLAQLNVDKRAVTAIEYALIAALIAVVIVGAATQLGSKVASTFNNVSSEL